VGGESIAYKVPQNIDDYNYIRYQAASSLASQSADDGLKSRQAS
jgi:hypothetical protein